MAVTTVSRADQRVRFRPSYERTIKRNRHMIHPPILAKGGEDWSKVLVSSHLFRPSDHSDSPIFQSWYKVPSDQRDDVGTIVSNCLLTRCGRCNALRTNPVFVAYLSQPEMPAASDPHREVWCAVRGAGS
jgi:hypothetical protein